MKGCRGLIRKRLLIFLVMGVFFSFCMFCIGSPVAAQRRIKIEKIIGRLKSENAHERRAAALELGELKNPKAVEPLIKALKDEDRGVRMTSAWALGRIGDKRAVAPLKDVSENDILSEVRDAALRALGKIEKSH